MGNSIRHKWVKMSNYEQEMPQSQISDQPIYRWAAFDFNITDLVALLSLSSLCLVVVVWFFLAVPWVSLWFVIVVFPDHTHLLCLCMCMRARMCVCVFV